MKVIRPVVRGEGERLAAELKASFRNAVAVAADERAKEWRRRIRPVLRRIIEAEHDIGNGARAVRHLQRRDRAAVRDRAKLEPVLVLQGHHLDRFTLKHRFGRRLLHAHPNNHGTRHRHRDAPAYKNEHARIVNDYGLADR